MGSHFEGMSITEIRGMPRTIDATALMICGHRSKFAKEHQVAIALAQERYVREVFIRCPHWRRRKKRALGRALRHAVRTTDLGLYGCQPPMHSIRADWPDHVQRPGLLQRAQEINADLGRAVELLAVES